MSGEELRAAAQEWAESEDVIRKTPSPSREQWQRVLDARDALRAALAAPSTPEPSGLREALGAPSRCLECGGSGHWTADRTGETFDCAICGGSGEADRAAPSTEPALDVERLGFRDLLDIADALLTRYPPGTIVCSHEERADVGANTAAAIGDLVASCRARLAESR